MTRVGSSWLVLGQHETGQLRPAVICEIQPQPRRPPAAASGRLGIEQRRREVQSYPDLRQQRAASALGRAAAARIDTSGSLHQTNRHVCPATAILHSALALLPLADDASTVRPAARVRAFTARFRISARLRELLVGAEGRPRRPRRAVLRHVQQLAAARAGQLRLRSRPVEHITLYIFAISPMVFYVSGGTQGRYVAQCLHICTHLNLHLATPNGTLERRNWVHERALQVSDTGAAGCPGGQT